MTRGGNSIIPGRLYHIIPRFVAKQWLMDGPAERNMYLSLLGLMLMKTDWDCIAYALMSNHIHLALVAGKERLATWLRPTHNLFANWLNVRVDRIGAVFVRGPNVGEVQPEGAAKLINYIHYNPVRAGVVADPKDNDWTSHRIYLGDRRPPQWLNVKLGLELAGFSDGASFGAWSASVNVQRSDVDAHRVVTARGREKPHLPEASTDVYDDGRAAVRAAIAAFAAGDARSASRSSDHA